MADILELQHEEGFIGSWPIAGRQDLMELPCQLMTVRIGGIKGLMELPGIGQDRLPSPAPSERDAACSTGSRALGRRSHTISGSARPRRANHDEPTSTLEQRMGARRASRHVSV
jgi:hypothetical protein